MIPSSNDFTIPLPEPRARGLLTDPAILEKVFPDLTSNADGSFSGEVVLEGTGEPRRLAGHGLVRRTSSGFIIEWRTEGDHLPRAATVTVRTAPSGARSTLTTVDVAISDEAVPAAVRGPLADLAFTFIDHVGDSLRSATTDGASEHQVPRTLEPQPSTDRARDLLQRAAPAEQRVGMAIAAMSGLAMGVVATWIRRRRTR